MQMDYGPAVVADARFQLAPAQQAAVLENGRNRI